MEQRDAQCIMPSKDWSSHHPALSLGACGPSSRTTRKQYSPRLRARAQCKVDNGCLVMYHQRPHSLPAPDQHCPCLVETICREQTHCWAGVTSSYLQWPALYMPQPPALSQSVDSDTGRQRLNTGAQPFTWQNTHRHYTLLLAEYFEA